MVTYRLLGGPLDGETTTGPPQGFHDAVSAYAEQAGIDDIGNNTFLSVMGHPEGFYSFDPDVPDLMVWRQHRPLPAAE